jgi:hypothetical protein
MFLFMSNEYIVNTPIADLRAKPQHPTQNLDRDPLQESQLLLGEHVRVLKFSGEWAKVECPEQPYYQEGEWISYPGWILRQSLIRQKRKTSAILQISLTTKCGIPLSLGSRLFTEPFNQTHSQAHFPDGRTTLLPRTAFERPASPILTAATFLEAPYLWGGRSAYSSNSRSSVDCSGLTSLVYQVHGKILPRNACDQRRACVPIDTPTEGDLVFLRSKEDPDFIDHVMLYAGNGEVIEATAETNSVRIIPLTDRVMHHKPLYGRPSTSNPNNF